jgi:hypothetical protein
MNRDDIIRMAHEADCLDEQHYGEVWVDKLTNFAELVATAEREECAKVLEGVAEWIFKKGMSSRAKGMQEGMHLAVFTIRE